MRTVFSKAFLLLTFVALAGSAPAWAQATGSIAGSVTDESGAVLPGVMIEVTNVETSQVRTAVTREDGFYTVPLLRPGAYQVKGTLERLQGLRP